MNTNDLVKVWIDRDTRARLKLVALLDGETMQEYLRKTAERDYQKKVGKLKTNAKNQRTGGETRPMSIRMDDTSHDWTGTEKRG